MASNAKNLQSLPDETLIDIFIGLDRQGLKEMRRVNERFAKIINDPYFWWKKAVNDGYTDMTFGQFMRGVENVAPTAPDTTVCSFKPDVPNPENLYWELQNRGLKHRSGKVIRRKVIESEIDDEYQLASAEYCVQQLNLAVAHGYTKSIMFTLRMLEALELDDGVVDISDTYIIAARRGTEIYNLLVSEIKENEDISLSVSQDHSKFMRALKEECENNGRRDVVANLLSLIFMSFGSSFYDEPVDDELVDYVYKICTSNYESFSSAVISAVQERLIEPTPQEDQVEGEEEDQEEDD